MKPLKVTTKELARREEDANEKLRRRAYTMLRYSEEESEAQKAAIMNELDSAQKAVRAPLCDYLASVNGQAHAHTLGGPEVVSKAEEIEKDLLERGVSRANLVGTEVIYRPAGKEASRTYERKAGASITTRIHLKRVTDGWRLVKAERDYCYVNQAQLLDVSVSVTAKDDIVHKATRSLRVKDAA